MAARHHFPGAPPIDLASSAALNTKMAAAPPPSDGALSSPDSTVTLLNDPDAFLRAAVPLGLGQMTAGSISGHPTLVQPSSLSYRDVMASFAPTGDLAALSAMAFDEERRRSAGAGPSVGPGAGDGNDHPAAAAAATTRRSMRSPAPAHLLGTSADSVGTGGSGGLGSSIWAVGPGGRDSVASPKLSWSTLDSGLERPMRSGSALWDADSGSLQRPPSTPLMDSSANEFDSDFNRSFDTLALEDSSHSHPNAVAGPSSAAFGNGFITPPRAQRPSFSGNNNNGGGSGASGGYQGRNLLSAFSTPTKPMQGFLQPTLDASPAGTLVSTAAPSPAGSYSRRVSTTPMLMPMVDQSSAISPSLRSINLATPNAGNSRMGPASNASASPYPVPSDIASWSRPGSGAGVAAMNALPGHYEISFPGMGPGAGPAAGFGSRRDIHEIPTRSLWIGNLDPYVDAAHLVRVFSTFGNIESLRVLRERDCAFVNFADVGSAVRARAEMEGARIGNQAVRIGFGRVEREVEPKEQQPTRSVWIGNLPHGIESDDLRNMFQQFGPIESARVLTHKNCGFVNFDRLENAIDAVRAMHGADIMGNNIRLGYAKVPPREGFPRPKSAEDSDDYGSITSPPTTYSWIDGPGQSMTINAVPSFAPEVPIIETIVPVSSQGDEFSLPIPELPEGRVARRVDQTRLREMRRRLDTQQLPSSAALREVDAMFAECEDEFVELSTDYIGNVVLQKILERSGDQYRQRFISCISPFLAAIGIHKNGTWLVQKIIQLARTPQQMDAIIAAIRPYTVQLLLDQVGNYVVQGCLKLSDGRNQFIYDAMALRCLEIATGRYGARAMRTSLEHPATTQSQQRLVAAAVVKHVLQLATNPNGVLLVTWLLETSGLTGRYRMLAPQFAAHMAQLACEKLASTIVVKLVNQRIEPDAREAVFNALFFAEGSRQSLQEVLSDYAHGVALLQKILSSTYVDTDDKIRAADRVRQVMASSASDVARNANAGYRRLLEELRMLPVGPEGRDAVAALAGVGVDAGLGPLRNPGFGFAGPQPGGSPMDAATLLQAAGAAYRIRTGMSDFSPLGQGGAGPVGGFPQWAMNNGGVPAYPALPNNKELPLGDGMPSNTAAAMGSYGMPQQNENRNMVYPL